MKIILTDGFAQRLFVQKCIAQIIRELRRRGGTGEQSVERRAAAGPGE